jgi:Raf kinase inhibitor-like YbhB/YbcL family protein
MSSSHTVERFAGEALASFHAGSDKLASAKLVHDAKPELAIASPWFTNGGKLPLRCTADGEGFPPTLSWSAPPAETRSLVLICEDPDAPKPEPFVHWLVYAIPTTMRMLDAASAATVREGKNSTLRRGYTPAAPPPGHGLHHYHFQLFALDAPIDLDAGEGLGNIVGAMHGHVLAWGELVGTYQRD